MRKFRLTILIAILVVGLLSMGVTYSAAQNNEQTLEVFHWWTAGGEKQAITNLFDAFREAFPQVTIKPNPVAGGAGITMKTVLKSLILAGKPPETFQVHAGYEMSPYVEAGNLQTINDIWTEEMRENIPGTLKDMVKFHGDFYAVPLDIHRANVVWYNTQIFKKYNIQIPQTLEEFFQVCKKLQAKGITPVSLGDRNKWPATHIFETLLISQGVEFYQKFINGNVEADNQKLLDTLQTFKRLLQYVNEDHAAETWDEAVGDVYQGEAAMNIMGDWANGYFKAKGWTSGEEYDIFMFPGTQNVYDLVVDCFELTKKAEDPEAGRKWLSFLGTVKAQNAFNPIKGSIPARTDAPKGPYGRVQKMFMDDLAAKQTVRVPSITHGSAVPPAFLSTLNDLVSRFVTNRNVEATANSIAQAVKSDFLPNKVKTWELGK